MVNKGISPKLLAMSAGSGLSGYNAKYCTLKDVQWSKAVENGNIHHVWLLYTECDVS